MVLVVGISLIPNKGNHTQNIPPITSVKDNKVNSAAGIALDPIEYKINPKQTRVPCRENNELLKLDEKNTRSLLKIIIEAKITQKKPAKAVVVNFGVSLRHLNETEKTEKPTDEVIPKTNPINEVSELLPIAIMPIPTEAIIIDIQTFKEIFSFKNKKANNAVKKGIAAKHKRVIAALVFVIENIKQIIATPRPEPPTKPEVPILK